MLSGDALELDALVCDLDGVVHRGEGPIEGAAPALERLRAQDLRLLFATNNGTKTIAEVQERLHGFEIETGEDEILTAALVTAEEITRRGLNTKTAYVVGRGGIRNSLEEVGITILGGDEGRSAELVVVSGDFEFNYEKMHIASSAVRNGATFIATNSDATFPDAGGLRPGAGAVLAGIETAGGRRAEVMGKPNVPMMKAAARRVEGARRIGIIGDQPDTDLAGGFAMGWTTILVLSGVTDKTQAGSLSRRPDLVLESIAELPEKIRR